MRRNMREMSLNVYLKKRNVLIHTSLIYLLVLVKLSSVILLDQG